MPERERPPVIVTIGDKPAPTHPYDPLLEDDPGPQPAQEAEAAEAERLTAAFLSRYEVKVDEVPGEGVLVTIEDRETGQHVRPSAAHGSLSDFEPYWAEDNAAHNLHESLATALQKRVSLL